MCTHEHLWRLLGGWKNFTRPAVFDSVGNFELPQFNFFVYTLDANVLPSQSKLFRLLKNIIYYQDLYLNQATSRKVRKG